MVALELIAKFLVWLLSKFEPIGGHLPFFERSPQWPALRAKHIAKEPVCQVCGARVFLDVHHILPVHQFPDRELDPQNLITLCRGRDGGCHLRFGHLWSWLSYNASVRYDAAMWRCKLRERPQSAGLRA